MIMGGMPESVATYAATRSLLETAKVAESLLAAFEEDVHKYSRSAQVPYVRHVLQTAPLFAGQRITYEHFGNSGFKSREIKRAMEVLEYAMIIQRVYGTHGVLPPIQPNTRVAPKLLYLDTGLVAHRFKADTLPDLSDATNAIFKGTLAEQVVGQELLAANSGRRDVPSFWYRNQPGATSEVDYCIQLQDRLVPIEVKSGKPGTLKSLQQFMRQAPHDLAVRASFENLIVDTVQLPDKRYQLLNVPLYMVGRIAELVAERASRQVK
jgi:predicted AAA+ superfamily ATPase